MKTKLVLIADGRSHTPEFDLHHNNLYYCLGPGGVVCDHFKNITDPSMLSHLALRERDEYTQWVFEQNGRFLKNQLQWGEDLSLFFLTEFSNKRSEIFSTYSLVCHGLVLKDKLNGLEIVSVEIFGGTVSEQNFFKEYFKNQFGCVANCFEGVPDKYSWTKLFISHTYYSLRFLWMCLITRFLPKISLPSERLLLSRYPIHFKESSREQYYGNTVGDTGVFFLGLLVDGLHQSLGFKGLYEAVQGLRTSKPLGFVWDRFFRPMDLLSLWRQYIPLRSRLKKILDERFVYKNMDISDLVEQELILSCIRIPRLRTLEHSFVRGIKYIVPKEFVYHLPEYCFGRFVTYLLRKFFPSLVAIGFQHGPASHRKMLHFMAGNEPSVDLPFIDQCPIPSRIMVEDEHAKEVYIHANFEDVQVMDSIPRLEYLSKIERRLKDQEFVLVACGLHDNEELFDFIVPEVQLNQHKQYLMKFHPKFQTKLVQKKLESLNLKNFKTVFGPIAEYLSYVNEVVVTYSSVGVEAHKLGIKVRVVALPGKINESPLLDYGITLETAGEGNAS